MRINQLFCNFGKGFREAFLKKYNLIPYTDPLSPAIFFGCYPQQHLGALYNHKGPAVVIWAGSDIKTIADGYPDSVPINSVWIQVLKFRPNIKHIAISKWIAEDLDKLDIPYKRLPILPHDISNIEPCKPGENVYMYNPGNPIYNGGIYEEVKKNLPFNIIEASVHTYTREQLMEIYRDCFVGLRFTTHDGLSNTICELGLMGRKVINNGDVPNCVPYETVKDVIEAVHWEYFRSRVESYAGEVSDSVKEYLNISEDFLYTEFYD